MPDSSSLLEHPYTVQEGFVHTTRLLDAVPEVSRDAVREQVFLEVDRHALQELLLADIIGEHAQCWQPFSL